MNARDFLERAQFLDELIHNKTEEAFQLRCLATGCTAPTDREPMGSGGVTDRVGNIGAKLADLERETSEIVDRFIDERQEIIRVIEKVEKPLYYTILHKHYIGVKYDAEPTWYMSLAEISEAEGYSYSHVCACHQSALSEVQRILDGR